MSAAGDPAGLPRALLLAPLALALAGCPAPPLDGLPALADAGPTPVGPLSGADLNGYIGEWSIDLQEAGQIGLRYVGEAACWRYDECASTRTELAGGPQPNLDLDGDGLMERYPRRLPATTPAWRFRPTPPGTCASRPLTRRPAASATAACPPPR